MGFMEYPTKNGRNHRASPALFTGRSILRKRLKCERECYNTKGGAIDLKKRLQPISDRGYRQAV